MQSPLRYDLGADRGISFVQPLSFLGYDFTGATYRAQVRLVPDATGSPLISLTTVTTNAQGIKLLYAGSATVAAHITAGRLPISIYQYTNPNTGALYASSDTVTLSQIRLLIDNSTMNGLPFPNERGDNLILAWDLLITLSGASEDKFAYGSFTVRGTVTQ